MPLSTSIARAAEILEVDGQHAPLVYERLGARLRTLADSIANPKAPPPRRRANETERRRLEPLLAPVRLFAELAELANDPERKGEWQVRCDRLKAAIDGLVGGDDRDVLQAQFAELGGGRKPLSSLPLPPPPPSLLPAATAGAGVLRMRSLAQGVSAELRIVARREFRFGRSHRLVDFPARFLPATTEAEALSRQVSSIHARMIQTHDDILLSDGQAGQASRSGTFFDGERVTTARSISNALADGAPHRLMLMPYELQAIWVSDDAGKRPGGAIYFKPIPPSRPVLWDAVWLLTQVGLVREPGRVLPRCAAVRSAPIVVSVVEEGFALEVRSATGEWRLDGERLAPNRPRLLGRRHQLGWNDSTLLLTFERKSSPRDSDAEPLPVSG